VLANIERIAHPLELAGSFKLAMSRVASSVALVTTLDESGRPPWPRRDHVPVCVNEPRFCADLREPFIKRIAGD
jgi:hypothetical protein